MLGCYCCSCSCCSCCCWSYSFFVAHFFSCSIFSNTLQSRLQNVLHVNIWTKKSWYFHIFECELMDLYCSMCVCVVTCSQLVAQNKSMMLLVVVGGSSKKDVSFSSVQILCAFFIIYPNIVQDELSWIYDRNKVFQKIWKTNYITWCSPNNLLGKCWWYLFFFNRNR